jgi:hypothetical protein
MGPTLFRAARRALRNGGIFLALSICVSSAGCRTDDILTATAQFKDDVATFRQLAAQVVADRRDSCARGATLLNTDPFIAAASTPPPPVDCTTAETQATKFAESMGVLTAYFDALVSASDNKAPDFATDAITSQLAQFSVITDVQAKALVSLVGSLSTYLVGHARVVAIQAAVRRANATLPAVDAQVQKVFRTDDCKIRSNTYCEYLEPERKNALQVYTDYVALSGQKASSLTYADRGALMTILHQRDAFEADHRKRIETGKRLAQTLHSLVQRHTALAELINRDAAASDAVINRL